MPDADNKFVQATDSLIALYRTVERTTLDLPFLSFIPMLIFFWAFLKFYFFLVVRAGGQGGSGVYYSKEREILAAVEVRVREAPTSLCRLRAKADITRCSKLHRSQQHLKSVSCRCFRAAGQGEAARGSAIGHTTERDLGDGLRS